MQLSIGLSLYYLLFITVIFRLVYRLLVGFTRALSRGILTQGVPLRVEVMPFSTFVVVVGRGPSQRFSRHLLLATLSTVERVESVFKHVKDGLFRTIVDGGGDCSTWGGGGRSRRYV